MSTGVALESLKFICQKVVQRPKQVSVATSKVNEQVLQPMLQELVSCHPIDDPCVLLVGTKDVGNVVAARVLLLHWPAPGQCSAIAWMGQQYKLGAQGAASCFGGA